MGLDAVIMFQADKGVVPDLPAGFEVQERPECMGRPEGATHNVSNPHRYYGPGYERGPWPELAGALMRLFATEGVRRVWYGSDVELPSEIHPFGVVRICLHYMQHEHRPYYL